MGISCLLIARVSGCSRDPLPPARMIPFSIPFSSPEPQPLAVVCPCLHLLAPVAVVEIPSHRFAQPRLEGPLGGPFELAADFRRVDRVASIVAGPVGDERLQRAPALR